MTALRAVLCDLEGTTSSIAFVRDVLFPYARQALPAFVAAHGHEPEVRRWLDQVDEVDGDVVTTLQRWIDEDRKHTALKALQGMIWREGYREGAYRAHFYRDAVTALRAWHAEGRTILVYSSGSVAAQQLFFRYSEAGDLTGLVSGWFDTEIGAKRDEASYRRIAAVLERPEKEIVFLSDVVAELDAARAAGMGTVLVDRRQDYPEPREGAGHPRVESFAEIRP